MLILLILLQENSVVRLSELVKDKDGNQILRQSAALALKNAVSSKDAAMKQQKQETWMRVTVPARGYVKQNVNSSFWLTIAETFIVFSVYTDLGGSSDRQRSARTFRGAVRRVYCLVRDCPW